MVVGVISTSPNRLRMSCSGQAEERLGMEVASDLNFAIVLASFYDRSIKRSLPSFLPSQAGMMETSAIRSDAMP